MAGEKELDPIALATEQGVARAKAERDYVDGQVRVLEERIAAMDVATRLLNETVNRVPTDLQTAMKNMNEVFDIRLTSLKELAAIREEYRLELKADAEKALTTAMTAAEKAVQAALAAAEKARDQQTIASQLATDKSELRLIDALSQQQETFTVAIANVVEGLNEAKTGLSDIRSEERGGKANQAAMYALVGFLISVLVLGGMVVAFISTGNG